MNPKAGENAKVEILISSCHFKSNYAPRGGALTVDSASHWSLLLNITLSHFEENTGEEGGALFIRTRCTMIWGCFVFIAKTQFARNFVTTKGSAIYLRVGCDFTNRTMTVNLIRSEFVDNIVQEKEFSDKSGGALLLSADEPTTVSYIDVRHAIWKNNTSTSHGGALAFHLYESSIVYITESKFTSNNAGLTSFGGACYFNIIKLGEKNMENENGYMVEISHSVFDNNTAEEGGSVFQTSSLVIDSKLRIQDSVFYCCEQTVADFVAVMTFTYFKNVQFYFVFQIMRCLFLVCSSNLMGAILIGQCPVCLLSC